MGLEATCKARVGKKVSLGEAYLGSTDLVFRGAFKLDIPFQEVKSVEAARGVMNVTFSGGVASFDLGKDAEKWALKIRYPRGLLEKLGVKPESRVTVLRIDDESFLAQLQGRTADVGLDRARKDSDLVFFGTRTQAELEKLASLKETIKPNGAIWVVWPKGKKELTEDHVRDVGRKKGLVDVKVVSFSDTLSSLKMVIPVAQRPKSAGAVKKPPLKASRRRAK